MLRAIRYMMIGAKQSSLLDVEQGSPAVITFLSPFSGIEKRLWQSVPVDCKHLCAMASCAHAMLTGGLHCRWCAMTMGLPLEAPREATRGWDVATLRAGMQGLNPEHAPKLGLFCRLESL